MSRPLKCRRVTFIPGVTYFKPAGIPLRTLEEIRLSVEEAEAIRLKDLEGLEQEEGAKKMNISRPTFQRVLVAGRQKIANALLHGKAIRIEGGNFEMPALSFQCINGHQWETPYTNSNELPPQFCPTCNSGEVTPSHLTYVNSASRGKGRDRRLPQNFKQSGNQFDLRR